MATIEKQLAAGVVPAGYRMPSYAELNVMLNKLMVERGEWCGMPMPLPGQMLVLEDKHPNAEQVYELQRIMDSDTPKPSAEETDAFVAEMVRDARTVNSWRGRTKAGVTGIISIIRKKDGGTTWGLSPDLPSRNRLLLATFDALDAWNLETELTAIDALSELLTERMFKAYVLLGQFLETSKRSGLTYWFRRLYPTVVLTPHKDAKKMQILCALCLHPLAYYATTRCGAMTPTDDVIAHLLMMRADEHGYWKRANQHPAIAPEAGL